MGKGSAEIAADNERRRNALNARVARLERRLQQDYGDVTGEVTGRFRRLTSGVAGRTEHVRERAAAVATSDRGSDSTVAQHPRVLVAGAAAAGFAAAAALHRDGGGQEQAKGHDEGPGIARRMAAKGATKGATGLAGFVRGEVLSAAKDFVTGAWEGHTRERDTPEPMNRARRDMLQGLERETWRPPPVELPS